ncbi:MAG: hypothetical protein L0338_35865 [Acidobacteria bacterium]|nr:hypothetical protein [Acidobacteriota bacterium]
MRIPKEQAASPLEVSAAIKGLTRPQLLRLEKYARFLIRGLPHRASRDHEDLLQEAMKATLNGDRRWNRQKVPDFYVHLLGVMRSSANHWLEQAQREPVSTEADVLVTQPNGETQSPLELAPSCSPDAERTLAAKQRLDEIDRIFGEDALVSLIIAGLREGRNGPEIQALLDVSQNDYDAALKRMRRRLRAPADGRQGHV